MQTANIFEQLGMTFVDYPDPINHALIVYFLGCEHTCSDCHNPSFKNKFFDKGKMITADLLFKLLKEEGFRQHTKQVVFSGGDPLFQNNRDIVRSFLNKYGNIFDVCIYTGYTMPQVKQMELSNFKYLKCGIYNKDLHVAPMKTDSYIQLASSNQEFYNSNFSLLSHNGRMYFK